MMIAQKTSQLITNRYELMDEIGAGGMGVVYRARDHLSQSDIALKSIAVNPLKLTFNSRTSDRRLNLALAREFTTLARLRHPNIVSVLDFGFEKQPFFTMPLVSGAHKITDFSHELDWQTKKHLVLQMLYALQYLHRHQILHRDLKPSNVLVTSNKQVTVLDFGLAIGVDEAKSQAGTTAYMAPEILSGSLPTIASDLYAVGLLAYELFTGEYPHKEANTVRKLTFAILNEEIQLPEEHFPPEIRVLVQRLLAKNPEARPQKITSDVLACFGSDAHTFEPDSIRDSYLRAARFVGRQTELSQLQQILQGSIQDAVGAICLVGGESGVGKTRLLEELRIHALVRHVQVTRGQAIRERAAPFQAWIAILQRLSLQCQLSASEASILGSIVPNLERLLGHAIASPPQQDPDSMQQAIFQIVEKMLSQQTEPLLIILEDLQWVDEEIKLLAYLEERIQSLPLMVIGTYRNDEAPSLPQKLPSAHTIFLNRLTLEEVRDLSTSMLGSEGSNPDLLQLLIEQTEGNVFFIVESMRALAHTAGRLDAVADMTLPTQIAADGIQIVVLNRLSHIPADAYPLVQLAALSGRQLHLPILQALAPDLNMDVWLQECASVFDIINEQWQFAHDKIREAVFESVEQPPKAHHKIAEAWEQVADDPDLQAVTLAYHWGEAGNAEKERHYAELAGHQTLRIGADSEALRYFDRALQLTPESATFKRATLYKAIGETYLGRGDLDNGLGNLHNALKLMSNPQPQSGEPANWHIARSLARQAIHRLIPGLPRIRTEKDAEGYLLQGAILSQLTYLFTYSLYDAKLSSSYLLNAINALEHTIASPMLAQAYFQMALGAQIAGLLRLARVYFRLGQQTLDQLTITDSHDFFLTLVYKAYAELSFGHLSTSEQTSLQGAEMLERLNTKLWFRVLNFPNLGLTYRFMGRFHESKAVGHKLVEYATTPLKLRQAISGGQAIIAQAAIRLHQLDEASDVLERRRELEETMRAGNESSTYLTYDTLLAWRRGDIPEVERLLPLAVDEVIDYTEQITAHEHAAIFNTFEVCLQLWESGQSSLTNLPELTERIRKLAKQYAKRHVAGRARYYWMEGLYAFNQGKGRRAAAHWKRAIDYANQTGAAYERAVAEYYLYRYITPDAGKLQDVRRAFEEIGAVWDAERIT